MLPISTPSRPVRRLRFQIREILAVVVGYGMAALFFRAFWPAGGPPAWLIAPAMALYAWLGLALSGPILLLRREPRDRAAAEPGSAAPVAGAGSHTWAEWAWLFVGSYWIVLGLFVIPARLHPFGPGDVLLFGLVPISGGRGIPPGRVNGRRGRAPNPGWTHPAAVWLLLTWPIAWVCLVAVGTRAEVSERARRVPACASAPIVRRFLLPGLVGRDPVGGDAGLFDAARPSSCPTAGRPPASSKAR